MKTERRNKDSGGWRSKDDEEQKNKDEEEERKAEEILKVIRKIVNSVQSPYNEIIWCYFVAVSVILKSLLTLDNLFRHFGEPLLPLDVHYFVHSYADLQTEAQLGDPFERSDEDEDNSFNHKCYFMNFNTKNKNPKEACTCLINSSNCTYTTTACVVGDPSIHYCKTWKEKLMFDIGLFELMHRGQKLHSEAYKELASRMMEMLPENTFGELVDIFSNMFKITWR